MFLDTLPFGAVSSEATSISWPAAIPLVTPRGFELFVISPGMQSDFTNSTYQVAAIARPEFDMRFVQAVPRVFAGLSESNLGVERLQALRRGGGDATDPTGTVAPSLAPAPVVGFSLRIVNRSDGRSSNFSIEKDTVLIGRGVENDVQLNDQSVSRQHAKLVRRDGKIIVADMSSSNGTFVGGKRLTSPQVLRSNSIQIGNFEIEIENPVVAPNPPASPPDPVPIRESGQRIAYAKVVHEVHDQLLGAMDLRRRVNEPLKDEQLKVDVPQRLDAVISAMSGSGKIPGWVDRAQLREDVINEVLGLGPIERYLADDSVTEIMVNGAGAIFIERDGRLEETQTTFSSDASLRRAIERIVAPIGRRIDESSPMVDARLKDGSRVNVVIPPLALDGPTITIRKFRRVNFGISDLISNGALSDGMAKFLMAAIAARRNILISGGTGSGKTTLLNILSGFIPKAERIVTIEDAAELRLGGRHVVRLEARPSNIEGKGEISIRDLVRNALRMRPDRIVVGECRGGEALDMLQAMNTGHDGSLTTIHANSARDALARLETLVLMAGMDLPLPAVRRQIQGAINLVVQQSRFSDGTRKVTSISEITGMEGDIITMQEILAFKQDGVDHGRVVGHFVATGFVPKFYDDLQRRGIAVDLTIFRSED